MKLSLSEPLYRHNYHNEKIGLVDRLFIKRVQEKPDFNRGMFDQDFAMLFLPMRRQSGVLFEVNSNDNELADRLLENVKTRYSPNTVDETIRELVGEIAQSLIWSGVAFYFVHNDPGTDKLHLAPFDSDSVTRLIGTHFQWMPKRTKTHWKRADEELPREIRILDAAKVVRVDMPKSIKRMLSEQNRILSTLDTHQLVGNEFYTPVTYENPNPTVHFDFRVWNEAHERALFRATRSSGWHGRKSDFSKRSDFFVCHRLIRFRRNQILLRDDILTQLSDELSRVGCKHNPDFSIKISGTKELPTVSYLDKLEIKLSNEEVGFGEIMDYCYQR